MSSIFDPGKKDRKAAANLAQQGVMNSGWIGGSGGVGAGFNFQDGHTQIKTKMGRFEKPMNMLIKKAMDAGTLPPEFMALGGDVMAGLAAPMDVTQMKGMGDMQVLGDIFRQSADMAGKDPMDLGMEISDRLTALSERRDQRKVNKMFSKLHAGGKLGTTGGAGIAAELDMNLQDQQLQRELAGMNFGQGLINDATNRMMGAFQGREGLRSRNFMESMGMQQYGDKRLLDMFGVGDTMMGRSLQQEGMDLQGLNTAMAMQQLPLNWLNAMMGAGSTAANTRFGAAGVHSNNAANARSPFLDIVNAAGGFMTGWGTAFPKSGDD